MEAILLLLVVSNFLLIAFFGIKSIKDYYAEKDKRAKVSEKAKKDYADLLKRPWALDQEKTKALWDKYPLSTHNHMIDAAREQIKKHGYNEFCVVDLRIGQNYTFGDVKEFCGQFVKKDHEGFAFHPIFNKCHIISDDGLVRFAEVSGIYEVPFIKMEELKNIKKPIIDADFVSKELKPEKYSITNVFSLQAGRNYFDDDFKEFLVRDRGEFGLTLMYMVDGSLHNIKFHNYKNRNFYEKQ